MRITNTLINIVAIAAVSAALFACSNGNGGGDAPLVDSSGKHPANWIQQHPTSAQSSLGTCAECHGSNLDGGIAKVSCFGANYSINGFQCHAASPANFAANDCSSCHNGPPNGPNGAAFPNNQGAHDTHTGVPSVTCSACHNGLGFGTAHHGDGTQVVSLSPGFQAETVVTDFNFHAVNPANQTNGGTCSGVSCHGGQVTPEWLTGKWSNGSDFDLTTDCQKCHERGTVATPGAKPTPQYNSYYSGDVTSVFVNPGNPINLHDFHLSLNGASLTVVCSTCHNTGTLSDPKAHFSGIATNTFTDPGAAVGFGQTKIGRYDKATKSCFDTNPTNAAGAGACHVANFVGHWQ